MIFCIKCGEEISESAEFCPKCGTRVSVLTEVKKNVKISKIIEESFKPSLSVSNFLIVFIPMLLLFTTLLYLGPQILLLIAEKIPEIGTGTVAITNLFIALLRMVSVAGLVLLIYLLFSIYQKGVVIHNIGNMMIGEPKPYTESLHMGLSRYLSLFIASLLLTILSMLLGSIRYIGWLLTLIVTCIFWVTYQGIVLDKLGFIEGFDKSFQYLRSHPTPYITVYIIATIISIIITVIGLIPLGVVAITLFPKILTTLIGVSGPSEILRTLANILASPSIYLASTLTCIIWTINSLYTNYGIPTKLYLEIGALNSSNTEN